MDAVLLEIFILLILAIFTLLWITRQYDKLKNKHGTHYTTLMDERDKFKTKYHEYMTENQTLRAECANNTVTIYYLKKKLNKVELELNNIEIENITK